MATPQGGAINVVRISGNRAVDIASSLFVQAKGASLAERKSHTVVFGNLYTGGELLDEALLTIMRAPHTYTGEDVVEISCHASPYITQQLLLALLNAGARQAEPGEFTMRAFLNGRMDLSRAEAVADLIASTSRASHRLAMNQLKGGFSNELGRLRDKLLKLTTLMELELDFGEEDVTFADRSELMNLCSEVEGVMSRLADSFSVGNAVKNGVPVAIVGETNTGKSTLLNTLLREDRAIVSDISGTTRDTIEGTMNIGGTTFRFIDTAGVRNTHDIVEQMGIERTLEQLKRSSIALWLIDPTAPTEQLQELAHRILPLCGGKKLAVVVNKSDAVDSETLGKVMEWGAAMVQQWGGDAIWDSNDTFAISARQGTNINKLEEFLVRSAAIPNIASSDVVVTNVRHYEALTHALGNIREVQTGLANGLPGDLVSEPLRAAIGNLSEILGEMTTDEVLGNIFANFCIGK